MKRNETGETEKSNKMDSHLTEELQERKKPVKKKAKNIFDELEVKCKRNSGPVKLGLSNTGPSLLEAAKTSGQTAKTPKAGTRNQLVKKAQQIKTESFSLTSANSQSKDGSPFNVFQLKIDNMRKDQEITNLRH